MRKTLFLLLVIFIVAAMNATNILTLKDVTQGELNPEHVSGITPLAGSDDYTCLSDDGQRVERYSYKDGTLVAVLFDSKEANGAGVTSVQDYILSPDGRRMLIETNHKSIYRRSFTADYYVYDIAKKTCSPLSVHGSQQVPTFSPDSRWIAFVRQNNIFLSDGCGNERQVTSDGVQNEIINGIPDWVNEEEFGFNNAMAWSGDSKTLSWIRYDEREVNTYELQQYRGDSPAKEPYSDYPGTYSYKYPKAGYANAVVSLWRYDIASGDVGQYSVPLDADTYVPRIKTVPSSPSIVVYTMNRHQDTLHLFLADPQTASARLILSEEVERYVKEEAMEGICLTDKHILLPSDRQGRMQLYLYDYNGKLQSVLQVPDGEVTEVYGYDERSQTAYCQVASCLPTEREVVAIGRNGKLRYICNEKGWNSAVFSSNFAYLINTWSDADHPYVFSVVTNKGRHLRILQDNSKLSKQLAGYSLGQKEFFSFTTSEGVTLNGWMVRPADFDSSRQYPVVMFQYSGPGSQQVVNSWRMGSMGQGALFDHYLASHGCIVACVDGRGTGGRGADFEKCTYLRLGDLESKDQVEAALYLGSLPYVDASRIAIWGWSYGGFNTLMSMSEGRPVFCAGVAVAPPTNWKYYDTIYTERYMRTPSENSEGYAINPIQRASALHGALLLCHGLADDNVHPQNTFEYSEALVQSDKDFKELIYTNRNHSINGGNTRNHLLRQVSDFLLSQLSK